MPSTSALTGAASAQTGDKRVTFAPEAKLSSAASGAVPDDWGFRFVVDPLRGVHYRVVRDLELICRFGGRTRSGNPPSENSTFGPQVGFVLAVFVFHDTRRAAPVNRFARLPWHIPLAACNVPTIPPEYFVSWFL